MSTVRITRARHPLHGQQMRVLGQMCRHGRVELLLVLPDGSKSLIPAAWTDRDAAAEAVPEGTLGSVADLLGAQKRVAELQARLATAVDAGQAARQSSCEEDNRAACAAESDAGLFPAPPAVLIAELPVQQVAAAVALLAHEAGAPHWDVRNRHCRSISRVAGG